MIKYLIMLTITILLSTYSAADEAPACEPPVIHPDTHFPVTAEYFQQFMNGEAEFSWIKIYYNIGLSPYCDDLPELSMVLESNYDFTDEMYWVDMTLNELEFFIGDLYDTDQKFYCAGYTIDENIMPIFEIIQNDLNYYCNAEEYNGEDSVEFINPWEMGIEFKNYIQITFYPPDISFYNCPPLKSIIKGWNPCDDPPEELMPLINYMEDVILPIARQHPRE